MSVTASSSLPVISSASASTATSASTSTADPSSATVYGSTTSDAATPVADTTTAYDTPSAVPELSKESLSRLAQSLPKYLIAGGVVLGVLIVLALLSWWWKRRKRRARFGLGDEAWDAIPSGPASRRVSESSEKVEKGKSAADSPQTQRREGNVGDPARAGNSEGEQLTTPARVYSPASRNRGTFEEQGRRRESGGSEDSQGSGSVVEIRVEDKGWERMFVPSLQSAPAILPHR